MDAAGQGVNRGNKRWLAIGVTFPNAERGRLAMYMVMPVLPCQRIPGLVGPQADVGPPLAGMGERRYFAGDFPITTIIGCVGFVIPPKWILLLQCQTWRSRSRTPGI